ncbi:copper resistance CopC family protein, partial [Methylomagnum sp.]
GGWPRGPPTRPPAGFGSAQPTGGRVGGSGVLFLLACLMVSPNALAHAILVKATPEREAVVAAAPEEVLLVFNDAVGEEFLALAVIDATGKRVDKHDAHLDFSARSHLRASVEKLPPGRYIVRYRVLSADGHVVSGKYAFQLQPQ